jgi:hypothetical protein
VPVGTGDLNFVVSDYHNSGFAWDPDNRLRRPSYDVLNASVDWSAPNNAWAVRLWGSNLTGQRYCVFETATTLLDSCAPASPRTYGITFPFILPSPTFPFGAALPPSSWLFLMIGRTALISLPVPGRGRPRMSPTLRVNLHIQLLLPRDWGWTLRSRFFRRAWS